MDLDEIKSRINPQYKDCPGTESYERKWLCDEIITLRQRVAELEKERSDLMQSIHDQADRYDELQQELELSDALQRDKVATLTAERDEWEGNAGQWEQEYYKVSKERDKATQYWSIAEGRCDALIKQRDELVAAMEPFVKHNSSKSVIDLAIRTSDITKARAAIASAKEKA